MYGIDLLDIVSIYVYFGLGTVRKPKDCYILGDDINVVKNPEIAQFVVLVG